MSNDPLTPTPIVDKNGKQTTVRRKTTQRMSHYAETRLAAAKPSTSPVLDRNPEIDLLGQILEDQRASSNTLISTLSVNGKLTDTEIETMLEGLHPQTLDSLDRLETGWKGGWLIIQQTAEACMKERNIAHINNLAMFHDTPMENHQERVFHSYIFGLQAHKHGAKSSIDYSSASEQEKESAHALLQAALALQGHTRIDRFRGSTRTHLTSNNLSKLILSRPKDTQRIIALINERRIGTHTATEIEHLKDILDQDVHVSLTEGVL